MMGQWEDFLKELAFIEVQYWKHLRGTKLSEHYILKEDPELSFGFKEDSDLSEEIKSECFEIFDKHRAKKRFA